MTQQKPLKKPKVQPLLEGFSILFYLCKSCAIIPYDFKEFRKYKILQKSQGGQYYVICSTIMVFINFNLMVTVFEDSEFNTEKNNLTIVIGFFLTYFSLVVFVVDRICTLAYQTKLSQIFQDIHQLDEEFHELNIKFDNRKIQLRNFWVLFAVVMCEAVIFIFTFTFLVERNNWTAWLWTFTAIPTFCNSLDKLWYISIVVAVRKRFAAIGKAFDEMALELQNKRKLDNEPKNAKTYDSLAGKAVKTSQIQPFPKNFNNYFGDTVLNPQIFHIKMDENVFEAAHDNISNTEELEEHFTKLCQLHDGLCQVMKSLNDIWRFPLLFLMGYGFFIITAQLYFYYCFNVGQVIPSIFRPARNAFISFVYLLYVTSKCIGILAINWLTDLESKKSAICLHRCALAADRNSVYEIVNHLSLKLFNHVLSFSACGFFRLDMSTFYGFCGGITSYLIILIQFNIEEEQVKTNSNPVAAVPTPSMKSMPLLLSNETNSSLIELISGNSSALNQQKAFDLWEFYKNF